MTKTREVSNSPNPFFHSAKIPALQPGKAPGRRLLTPNIWTKRLIKSKMHGTQGDQLRIDGAANAYNRLKHRKGV